MKPTSSGSPDDREDLTVSEDFPRPIGLIKNLVWEREPRRLVLRSRAEPGDEWTDGPEDLGLTIYP